MPDKGGNLPRLINFRNKRIKDIVISKEIGNKKNNFIYIIKVTEQIENKTQSGMWPFIKTKIVYNENIINIPFSFKTYEIAKDFAQFIPDMTIDGDRLYMPKMNKKTYLHNLIYETFCICIKGIDKQIRIKFIKDSEHKSYLKQEKDFYINDLDKLYYDNSKGNFYSADELTVDKFYTKIDFVEDFSDYNKSYISLLDEYETISEFTNMINENTHKFILIEDNEKES